MLEALNSGEKAPWYRGKLMVIGEGRAGKTATIRSLLKQKFIANLESTVGVDTSETQTGGNESWRTLSTKGYTDTFIKMVIANPDKVRALKETSSTEVLKSTGAGTSGETEEKEEKEEKNEDAETQQTGQQVKPKNEAVKKEVFENVYEKETNRLAKGVTLRDAIKISIWDYGKCKTSTSLQAHFERLTRPC